MVKVTARAPTRIDIAGGTLDLWPIHHLLKRKATVNVGVTLDAQVDVEARQDKAFHAVSKDQGSEARGDYESIVSNATLPLVGLLLKALWHPELPGLTITTSAKSPAGAGLGGSSCLGVTIAAAIARARKLLGGGDELAEDALVRTVQDVEALLIHAPTGVQDYWGGMRGRVNIIRFPFGNTSVQTLPPERLPGLERELILCYSGKSRASAINNWEIFKRLFDRDAELLERFQKIGALADDCAAAVEAGDYEGAMRASESEWALRLQLWPNIETAETKRLDVAARAAGARLSRVCGAGGGGVMAVFANASKVEAVKKALSENGGTILNASVAPYGLEVRDDRSRT